MNAPWNRDMEPREAGAMLTGMQAWFAAERERQAKWSPEKRASIQAAIAADYDRQAEYDALHCSECEMEFCCCDEGHDQREYAA